MKNIYLSELMTGIKEELEHKDVTHGDLLVTAKIALAHLKEDEHYYTKLKKAGLINNPIKKADISFYATKIIEYRNNLNMIGIKTTHSNLTYNDIIKWKPKDIEIVHEELKRMYFAYKYPKNNPIIRSLPLDKLTTTGDKRIPKYGDVITWYKYMLEGGRRIYKQEKFGTNKCNKLLDEFNSYYLATMRKIDNPVTAKMFSMKGEKTLICSICGREIHNRYAIYDRGRVYHGRCFQKARKK